MLDAWALMVMAGAIFTIYRDNIPQFIEFFSGATIVTGIVMAAFIAWWIGGKLKATCSCCWRRCRDGFVVETYVARD